MYSMGESGGALKIVALMMCRNEDWVIARSLKAALKWVDAVAFYADRCVDDTVPMVRRILERSGKPYILKGS